MVRIEFQQFVQNPAGCMEQVRAGETVVVVEADKELAEIRPAGKTGRRTRPFGLCAGEFVVPPDFDDPLPPEILDSFEGP